jgi:hypothetical protein
MAGGIQKGTEAGSIESKQLDGDVKSVAEAIAQYLKIKNHTQYFYEFGHQNYTGANFSKKTISENALPELAERGVTVGCVPDGGMWFDGPRSQPRTLKVAFEAKYQQDGGNAIERWGKNYLLCYRLSPDVKYVTFMTGAGATPGGVLHKFGTSMSAMNGPNCIFYYSPNGFTQEGICNIMASALGLDITFDQIQPYINQKISNNFHDLYTAPETAEERAARLAESEKQTQIELAFSQFAQNPEDPLYPVWHRLPRENKVEAKEIVLEMLQEGKANAVIATTLVECFMK